MTQEPRCEEKDDEDLREALLPSCSDSSGVTRSQRQALQRSSLDAQPQFSKTPSPVKIVIDSREDGTARPKRPSCSCTSDGQHVNGHRDMIMSSARDHGHDLCVPLLGSISSQKADSNAIEPKWLSSCIAGPILLAIALAFLVVAGCLFSHQTKQFINTFSAAIHRWGAAGILAFFVVYVTLELLMAPVIPLTMMAGAVFNVVPGTIISSVAGSLAAVLSFLIARYLVRDTFKTWADSSPHFRAIDQAIGLNGFKVIVLLRLSPIFFFCSASNYLYGLTSVSLSAYTIGSWIGMLPGTFMYVLAGKLSRMAIFGKAVPLTWWQVLLAIATSALTIIYIGRLARKALVDMGAESIASALDEGSVRASVDTMRSEEHHLEHAVHIAGSSDVAEVETHTSPNLPQTLTKEASIVKSHSLQSQFADEQQSPTA